MLCARYTAPPAQAGPAPRQLRPAPPAGCLPCRCGRAYRPHHSLPRAYDAGGLDTSKMQLYAPADTPGAKVSIFVASLPHSGMLFARSPADGYEQVLFAVAVPDSENIVLTETGFRDHHVGVSVVDRRSGGKNTISPQAIYLLGDFFG